MRRDIDDGTSFTTPVSAAGRLAGTLDTSALAGDFTIDFTISKLADGKTARIALEDSTNATFATGALTLAVWNFSGPIIPQAPITVSLRAYQLANARRNVANAALGLNVLACDANAALAVHAQADY